MSNYITGDTDTYFTYFTAMASESLLLVLLASAQVATSHQTSDKMSGVHLLVSAVTVILHLLLVTSFKNDKRYLL